MRRRFTMIHIQMPLKEYIIGSHLCTNISAFKTDMVILIKIRVFLSLFYHC